MQVSMLFVLARSRRLVTAFALVSSGAVLVGCSLVGDNTGLPPFTDPAKQSYATSTGVTLANMTRVNAQVYTQDIIVGTGRTVAIGDSISVYYVGRLTGGFQFDGRARPATTFATVLDTTRLIKGWVNGLPGMKVGGTRRMLVGPEFAYRFSTVRDINGNVSIPPNSVLVFDVELVEALARP